jgi:hypothetical protein
MPAAVPAILPKPKTAAMIAITKNINAQLSMIKVRRCDLTSQSGFSLLADGNSRLGFGVSTYFSTQ